MAVMTNRQSVAANATVDNVLAGKLHEFLTEASVIRVFATAAVIGMNISLLVGGEAVVDDQEINAENRMPLRNEDLVTETIGDQGDRLILRLRNTTGAAVIAFTILETEPLG